MYSRSERDENSGCGGDDHTVRADLKCHVNAKGLGDTAEHAEREVRSPGFDPGKRGLSDPDPCRQFCLRETRPFTSITQSDAGTEQSTIVVVPISLSAVSVHRMSEAATSAIAYIRSGSSDPSPQRQSSQFS